jgi:tetratricopeptide (TPR) repeat protein
VRILRLILCLILPGPFARAAEDPEQLAPPPRNEGELKLLPAAVLTEAGLPAEIGRMVRSLRAGLDGGDLADADRVLAKYAGNTTALANAAAVAWVQRSPGAALLLAAEAARADPSNVNSLNTLGALLANAGYGHKAIPVLQLLVQLHPDNARALNNLGQAWFALGEIEQAEPLLKRSLALAPRLGAAHAALGIIAQSRGHQADATTHYQAAVSANYSPTARTALDRQEIHYHLPVSFAELLATGEYFNPGHFMPPRPPRRGEEGKMKHRELEAYEQFLSAKKQLLEAQGETAKVAGEKIAGSDPMRAMAMVHSPAPLAALAALASHEEWLESQEVIDRAIKKYKSDIARLAEEKNAGIQKINDDFEKNYGDKYGEGMDAGTAKAADRLCPDRKAVVDTYLKACADDYEQMEMVVLPRLRHRTNTALACLAITSSGPFYQEEFARKAQEYLNRVSELAGMIVIEEAACKEPFLAGDGKKPEGEIPRLGDCPIHASLDLEVVTLKADCRTFGFEFKAGLEFSATKDFISGETTLTAGLATPALSLGHVVSGGGSAEFVIVWDHNNNLSYVGVETEGHAAVGPIVKISSTNSLGVTIGPQGVDPDIRGATAAEVLGHEIFEAKI